MPLNAGGGNSGVLNSSRFSGPFAWLFNAPSIPLHTSPPGPLSLPVPSTPLGIGFLPGSYSCSCRPSFQEPSKPATQLPLWEVAGSEGIILVQVPFLMADFSHIKAILGSFLENLAKFTKKLNIPPSLITSLWLFYDCFMNFHFSIPSLYSPNPSLFLWHLSPSLRESLYTNGRDKYPMPVFKSEPVSSQLGNVWGQHILFTNQICPNSPGRIRLSWNEWCPHIFPECV